MKRSISGVDAGQRKGSGMPFLSQKTLNTSNPLPYTPLVPEAYDEIISDMIVSTCSFVNSHPRSGSPLSEVGRHKRNLSEHKQCGRKGEGIGAKSVLYGRGAAALLDWTSALASNRFPLVCRLIELLPFSFLHCAVAIAVAPAAANTVALARSSLLDAPVL